MNQKMDTLQQTISRMDTIYFERIDPALTQQYLNILSDTNSQLNSSYTPLVISIAILTGLIGLGGIAAAYFIWSQGKDFEKRQNQLLAKSQEKISELEISLKLQFNSLLESISKESEEVLRGISPEIGDTLLSDIEDLKYSVKELNNLKEKVNNLSENEEYRKHNFSDQTKLANKILSNLKKIREGSGSGDSRQGI